MHKQKMVCVSIEYKNTKNKLSGNVKILQMHFLISHVNTTSFLTNGVQSVRKILYTYIINKHLNFNNLKGLKNEQTILVRY